MKTEKKTLFYIILLAVIIFVAFFFLNQQEIIMKATTGNHTDSLKQSSTAMKSQSFFNQEPNNIFILQSTLPVDAEKPEELFLEMKVVNSYPEYVTLINADIFKNGLPAGEQRFDAPINTGGTFLFTTNKIDLSGIPAVRNKLEVVFHLKGTSGKDYEQTFIYYYYPLTQCNSNTDCGGATILCDKTNKAGFSQNPLHDWYCVRICNANQDCPTGQLCKTGVCG
jgi:hypothetical protein